MHIIGIDFTSAPKPKKPIVGVFCHLEEETLRVESCQTWADFELFTHFLEAPGSWVAAVDFPLSLPQSWLKEMGWPQAWEASVRYIRQHFLLSEFCAVIKQYRATQPPGKKLHFRAVDRLAGACSPMTIDYTPVGRMFYQGAYRLLDAKVCVLPFCEIPTDTSSSQKIAFEGYPALIARRLAPKQSYKSDAPKLPSPAHWEARRTMLAAIRDGVLTETFGFAVDLNGFESQLLEDGTGDRLDALFCAIQAAWAMRQPNYGIPQAAPAQEGWICDPSLGHL